MKKAVILVLIAALGYGIYYLDMALPTGTGYASKYLCSQSFIAGRDMDAVFEEDIKPFHPLFLVVSNTKDDAAGTVTSAAFGFWSPITAVYREGFGCTLMIDSTRSELLAQVADIPPRQAPLMDVPWPQGESVQLDPAHEGVDLPALKAVVADAFEEPSATSHRNTHAIVVVHRGELIAEAYNPEFTPQTPILGWSMTKTITAALMGIMNGEGEVDVTGPAPIPEWQGAGDPRGAITVDQLLRMSSGLEFEERYGPGADAVIMLYERKDMGAYAAEKPLAHEPDTVWSYSSGTTNLLSLILRRGAGGDLASLTNYTRAKLLDPIGMKSAIIEADASGSFVGSSYMYASARDWARFGMLLEQGGRWGDGQILPEAWVTYMTTPSHTAPTGEYGGQMWLNAGKDGAKRYPSLPEELAYLGGFNGQIVAIFPSKDLVVVRLGATTDGSWSHEEFLGKVLETLKEG